MPERKIEYSAFRTGRGHVVQAKLHEIEIRQQSPDPASSILSGGRP